MERRILGIKCEKERDLSVPRTVQTTEWRRKCEAEKERKRVGGRKIAASSRRESSDFFIVNNHLNFIVNILNLPKHAFFNT